MKKILIVTTFLLPFFVSAQSFSKGEYYLIRKYIYQTAWQEQLIGNYLENAFIPALHKQGIKNIGAFSAYINDTAAQKQLFVLIPFKNLEQFARLDQKLLADNSYNQKGAAYINARYDSATFGRMEQILLKSFSHAPEMKLPKLSGPRNERVYELRSYESASEKIYRNKVHMFNEGDEIGLFNRLNFNAIFYGDVIVGSKMPNLMYLTSFENMEDRNKHWDSFGKDPQWKKLSSAAEYQNNVSHIDITFLRPLSFSDY